MRIEIDSYSRSLIESVMEKTAIFTLDEFPLTAAYLDSGTGDKNQSLRLRAKWLYDKYGFYTNASSYSTFPKRIFEYFHHGDFINTTRQRLNIIHEMMDCNFDTSTPVHISIGPSTSNDRPGNNVLDLNDVEKLKDFKVIAHPGQTRLQASIMLSQPLTRFLIYINKDFLNEISLSTAGLREISNIDELIKHYRIRDNRYDINEINRAVFNFHLPYLDDEHEIPVKYHKLNETYILKLNEINVYDKEDKLDAGHPSLYYLTDSFLTTDNYFRILTNNTLNIYTEDVSQIKQNNFNNVLRLRAVYSNSDKLDTSVFDYLSGYREYGQTFNENYSLDSDKLFYLEQLFLEMDKSDKYSGVDKKTVEDIDYTIRKYGKKEFSWKYNFYNSKSKSITDIVKDNDYRGYCLVYNNEHCKRTFEELLMLGHPNFSIAKSSDDSIAVINCEHSYWKTGEDYREYIITDKFLGL